MQIAAEGEFDQVAGNGHGRPEAEDRQQQRPECCRVLLLYGVEPVAIEEGQPHGDADLSLIDEHQHHNHGDGDGALAGGEARQRPDARLAKVMLVEIEIGDWGHLLHDGNARDEVDDDGEDGDRHRHAFGRRIGLQRGRQHPAAADKSHAFPLVMLIAPRVRGSARCRDGRRSSDHATRPKPARRCRSAPSPSVARRRCSLPPPARLPASPSSRVPPSRSPWCSRPSPRSSSPSTPNRSPHHAPPPRSRRTSATSAATG